ncbi:MAG: ShlB/FhaC/HecB family hemolysin secretion/activation protein [bacterium]
MTAYNCNVTSYLRNNIFKANNLQKNEVFKINNIQKSMILINNTDYIKGNITIQKGEEPATTDITLDVKDKLPLDLSAGWDNQGRDLIGVQRANIFLTDNNLTGFGDSLYGGVSLAQRTFGINSGYSLPIGPYGTELRLGYSNSSVNIGGSFEQLKIHGASRMLSTTLSQPIFKGDKFNLTSNFSFDLSHSKTTMQEITELQDYGLRVFRFGLNAVKEDNRGRWISGAQVSTGIPVCDAESKSKLGELSGKFVKFNTNIIRVQALPLNTTGIFRVSTQFSPNNLLSAEQMQTGGSSTVRGFNEGLLIGDVGYNASAELIKTIPSLPDFSVPYWKNKSFRVNLKDRMQFAAFYDQGFARVLEKDTPATYANFLQGVGVGLRCQLSKYLTANIDVGLPLGRKRSENQNSVKLHFGLSSNLF